MMDYLVIVENAILANKCIENYQYQHAISGR